MTEREALQESYWVNREIELQTEIQGLNQELEILKLEKILHLYLISLAKKTFSDSGISVISETGDTFSELSQKIDWGFIEKTLSNLRKDEILQLYRWSEKSSELKDAIQKYWKKRFLSLPH